LDTTALLSAHRVALADEKTIQPVKEPPVYETIIEQDKKRKQKSALLNRFVHAGTLPTPTLDCLVRQAPDLHGRQASKAGGWPCDP